MLKFQTDMNFFHEVNVWPHFEVKFVEILDSPTYICLMKNGHRTQENLEQVRVFLQKEFIARCKKNPAYSLRAFANYLEIDQSFLSKILKGHRNITPDFASIVGPKIGLKTSDLKELFTDGTKAMPGFLSLSEDEFDLLSEWHHFAILELAKTDDFELDALKIAKRLGLHSVEVHDALARLQRLGFIQMTENKLKTLSPNTTWSNTQKTSIARKKFQRTLIERSLDAIDHVPFELRENGSVTVAINKSRLPEFKEKIREMRKELADFFQTDDEQNLDEVYQLTVAFFPLTKIKDIQGE